MPEIRFEKYDITVLFDDEEFQKVQSLKLVARKTLSGTRYINIREKDNYYSIASKIFNVPKGKMILHKNGNEFDFRKSQISIVKKGIYFHKKNSNNNNKSSKYLRVFYSNNNFHPWNTHVIKDGKKYHGGRYDLEEEAAIASDYLAHKVHKKNAIRNFPELSIKELTEKFNKIKQKYGYTTKEKFSKTTQGISNINVKLKTSRFVGVYKNKRQNKWVAEITYFRKKYWLGLFSKETDAAKAYDKKALELYGENAKLNFKK